MTQLFFLTWICEDRLDFSLLEGISDQEALNVLQTTRNLICCSIERGRVAKHLADHFQVIRNILIAEKMA